MDVSGSSVHNDGEIYAAAMWRLKEYWTGPAPLGDRTTATLLDTVVDGMNYPASGPAYEDMRDGILQALISADGEVDGSSQECMQVEEG